MSIIAKATGSCPQVYIIDIYISLVPIFSEAQKYPITDYYPFPFASVIQTSLLNLVFKTPVFFLINRLGENTNFYFQTAAVQ